MASLIALLLIATMAFSLAVLPIANAHTPPWTNIPTHCYVAATPEVVGVGQSVLIVFWIDWIPPTSRGAYGDRWQFYLDITAPDGTNETLGPYTSDPVGGSFATYVPTQTGTYSLQARFPGATIRGLPLYPGLTIDTIQGAAYVNDTFAASTSEIGYFTAQQEQLPKYEETPLPEGYWTRPVHGANREWYRVTANWLGGAAQTQNSTSSFGYGKAPESAHVLWTQPLWEGGIMDERFGNTGYYTGLSYESLGGPDIILNGRIYYNVMAPPRFGWWCIDLHTGEKLFFVNTTGPWATNRGADGSGMYAVGQLSFGQIHNYDSPNQHGGIPYLWATNTDADGASKSTPPNTWYMYDPFTGNYISSLNNTNLATGTAVYGKDGSILRYQLANLGTSSAPNYYLRVWNTTRAILDSHPEIGNWYWRWRPFLNYTHDGRLGYSLNVSIANILGPRNAIANQTGTIKTVRQDQFVIIGTDGKNDARGTVEGYLRALSLKSGEEGRTLWEIKFTPPKAYDALPNSTYLVESSAPAMGTVDPENGVFLFEERVTRTRWAYSLATGQLLWGPSAPEAQFNYYGMSDNIYRGKLYSYGYSGILLAYDIKTGEVLWNWTAPSEGLGETWYPYSPLSLSCIADGKLYLYSTEHSPSMPLRRDAHTWCVDAETGKLLWKIQHWGALKLADGYLVGSSLFDNQIYCYGKGPSATTVTAPQTVPSLGSSAMITGTVTDQSPSDEGKGTPAISDDDMEAWMEYLYQQRAKPTNANGVNVTLDTIDPNGNFYNIGTVTSDIDGKFGYMFTPEVPGTYQIIASFAGSKSYGPSSARTYLAVAEAPTTTTSAPQQQAPSDNTLVIIGMGIAIIIAIVIVGLLILRKRP